MTNDAAARTDRRIVLEDLLGSWRLLSAVQHFEDCSRVAEFGASATGYLSYTAGGTVSAVLGSADRPTVAASDPLDATDAEYASSARRFVAYAGTFRLDETTGEVHHEIEIALFPNWQGKSQLRLLELSGDTLSIEASPRTDSEGRTFHSQLRWRRVR